MQERSRKSMGSTADFPQRKIFRAKSAAENPENAGERRSAVPFAVMMSL